jgi:hypothetical protein
VLSYIDARKKRFWNTIPSIPSCILRKNFQNNVLVHSIIKIPQDTFIFLATAGIVLHLYPVSVVCISPKWQVWRTEVIDGVLHYAVILVLI